MQEMQSSTSGAQAMYRFVATTILHVFTRAAQHACSASLPDKYDVLLLLLPADLLSSASDGITPCCTQHMRHDEQGGAYAWGVQSPPGTARSTGRGWLAGAPPCARGPWSFQPPTLLFTGPGCASGGIWLAGAPACACGPGGRRTGPSPHGADRAAGHVQRACAAACT